MKRTIHLGRDRGSCWSVTDYMREGRGRGEVAHRGTMSVPMMLATVITPPPPIPSGLVRREMREGRYYWNKLTSDSTSGDKSLH